MVVVHDDWFQQDDQLRFQFDLALAPEQPADAGYFAENRRAIYVFAARIPHQSANDDNLATLGPDDAVGLTNLAESQRQRVRLTRNGDDFLLIRYITDGRVNVHYDAAISGNLWCYIERDTGEKPREFDVEAGRRSRARNGLAADVGNKELVAPGLDHCLLIVQR